MGNALIRAIFNRDYPVIQAMALFLAMIFVLVNLSVDLLYGYIDPRIKQG
jgi:ABC-type dipeptide/oligopeptide/nickel transport system permease component